MSTIKAVIGLGNPGTQYAKTRHSIGFAIVDALAEQFGGSWRAEKNMELATIIINDQKIVLCKPMTFMNNSGEVIPLLTKKGIKVDNILVVHDELEKPFGSITIKRGGSARGHNGLRSIIHFCGPDFMRLRFGVGRPDNREMIGNYVLQKFDQPQDEVKQLIDIAVDRIVETIES